MNEFLPIDGLRLLRDEGALHVYSDEPLAVLSSAVVGGELDRTCHIVNMRVPRGATHRALLVELGVLAHELGIVEPFVGLMTAADLERAQVIIEQDAQATVVAIVTMGISHPTAAGVTQAFNSEAGTINIIVIVDARLNPAARVNAVITATEAKTLALVEAGVRAARRLRQRHRHRCDRDRHHGARRVVRICRADCAGGRAHRARRAPRHAQCLEAMMRALVLPLAVVMDGLLGEPPNAWHPIAWFGRFVGALERRAPRDNPRAELLYGAGLAAVGLALAAAPALVLERVLRVRTQRWPGLFVAAALLKTTLAWRALIRAGETVRRQLEEERLDEARFDLRALVSRDTSQLDTSLLAAAAIESLAENASDSFVAPLFYYQLFGLAGACAYRGVNTMDAMIGYHGRYEFLGKVAARLDDVLNVIPSRLTALLMVVVARLAGAHPRRAWHTLRRDHSLTASPNAGYPMSAMAGALDVRLEKVDHYCLNEAGRAPRPDDIRRAAHIVTLALGFATAAGVVIQLVSRD